MVKFTPEDRKFIADARQDSNIDAFFKDIRAYLDEFTGSTVTFLKIGDKEWGKRSPPGHVFLRPPTIPNDIAKQPKPTTKNAKRRALTKYKE